MGKTLILKNFKTSFGNIEYLEGGSGDKVFIYIHGAGGYPTFAFDLLYDLPNDKFRIIAPRIPSHGNSYKVKRNSTYEDIVQSLSEFIEKFVANENVSTAIISGQSLGGRLAVDIYNKKPDLFSHLILFAPFLEGVTFRNPVPIVIQSLLDMKRDNVMVLSYKKLKNVKKNVGFNLGNVSQFWNALKSMEPLDDRVAIKTLLLWGDDDHVLPLSRNQKCFPLFDHLKFVQLSGHHYAYLANLDITLGSIRDFIKN